MSKRNRKPMTDFTSIAAESEMRLLLVPLSKDQIVGTPEPIDLDSLTLEQQCLAEEIAELTERATENDPEGTVEIVIRHSRIHARMEAKIRALAKQNMTEQ